MSDNKQNLSINGVAGSPIWTMVDGPESHPIGIRLDCGDGGAVYVSKEQALDLAEQLNNIAVKL